MLKSNRTIYSFGCWNNKITQDDNNDFIYLKFVINKLNDDINSNIFSNKQLIILGDNYYVSNKTKNDKNKIKTKNASVKDMINGFNILDEIKIQKKIIMGNHDTEYYSTFDNESLISEDKYSAILLKQLELNNSNLNMYPTFKVETFDDQYLFMYIDTTLYEDRIDCRKYLYPDYNYDLEINKQNNLIIQNIIQNIDKKIFIFGHHPLMYFKYGKKISIDKLVVKEDIKLDILNLFCNLDESYDKLDINYICADYHIFEYGLIHLPNNIIIHQHIYGTGGTVLDELFSDDNYNKYMIYHFDDNKINYQDDNILPDKYNNIIYKSIFRSSNHGFGKISLDPDSYSFNFHSINSFNILNYCNSSTRFAHLHIPY